MRTDDNPEPAAEREPAHEPDTAPADSAANTDNTDSADSDTNAEAAKYRRRLREAEQQRDELADRVSALQRRQAEAMLPAAVKPAAVWAVTELADVLDDDGLVDAAKLDAAVTAAREHFGITKPPKGTFVPGVGNQPDGRPRADGWKQAFTPSRKR